MAEIKIKEDKNFDAAEAPNVIELELPFTPDGIDIEELGDDTNLETAATLYIPLRGLVMFPGVMSGFDAGRECSIRAVEYAMAGDRRLIVSAQKDASVEDPEFEDCYSVGVIIKVKQVVKKANDHVRIMAIVEDRVRITSIFTENEMFKCNYVMAPVIVPDAEDIHFIAHERMLRSLYEKYTSLEGGESAGKAIAESIDDPVLLCDIIASELSIDYNIKQMILEIDDLMAKMEFLIEVISRENQIKQISMSIDNRVMHSLNAGQKEHYLRQKMQAIREELGETDDPDEEIQEWLKKLDELQLPEKIDEKVRKEINKFGKMNMMSADANVSRTYIETIFDLPWHSESKTNINLKKAEKILNEDHYGLEKVKERILENLAVMHLTKSLKGPIICLVGPPGVGKTSIARSIARATNREFVRMSLGGVRDEAEIRGHRRTYVGAIPGRIITNLIECGVNNPLFLFDEVDKIGADYKGDPASALLEVLDPEQNKDFTDHYLEIPFDLSKVMFITTANTTSTIPRPLLDRMEIIEVSSYIEEEKVMIASKYLVPKQMKECGMKPSNVQFSEGAIREIIRYYTREAGVRGLEKQINAVCRKIAKRIVTEKKKRFVVNAGNIESYLGKKIYLEEELEKDLQVGVATGLAWTSVGGVTLSIETIKMPGTGKLILTGQMGDVMKESAQAALGYIKSLSEKYEIDPALFKEYDLQIHIPEGATPKDGPSAGVTMCTALFSLLTGKKVDTNVAMTGEITLRGKILPVGGIKEKVLAAYRQGITKILIPKECEAATEEIPASVRKKLTFVLLETAEDAFKEVINED